MFLKYSIGGKMVFVVEEWKVFGCFGGLSMS